MKPIVDLEFPRPTVRQLKTLLDEVETLCRVHVGKNAESEPWGDTLKCTPGFRPLIIARCQALVGF